MPIDGGPPARGALRREIERLEESARPGGATPVVQPRAIQFRLMRPHPGSCLAILLQTRDLDHQPFPDLE